MNEVSSYSLSSKISINGHIIITEDAREGIVIKIFDKNNVGIKQNYEKIRNLFYFDPRLYKEGENGYMQFHFEDIYYLAYVERTTILGRADIHFHIIVISQDEYSKIKNNIFIIIRKELFINYSKYNTYREHLDKVIVYDFSEDGVGKYFPYAQPKMLNYGLFNSWLNGNKVIYLNNDSLIRNIVEPSIPILGWFNFTINFIPFMQEEFDIMIINADSNTNINIYNINEKNSFIDFLIKDNKLSILLNIIDPSHRNLILLHNMYDRHSDLNSMIHEIIETKNININYNQLYEYYKSDIEDLLSTFENVLILHNYNEKNIKENMILYKQLEIMHTNMKQNNMFMSKIYKYKNLRNIMLKVIGNNHFDQKLLDTFQEMGYPKTLSKFVYKQNIYTENEMLDIITSNDYLFINNPNLLTNKIINKIGFKKGMKYIFLWLEKTKASNVDDEDFLIFDLSEIINQYFKKTLSSHITDIYLLRKYTMNNNYLYKYLISNDTLFYIKLLKFLLLLNKCDSINPKELDRILKCISVVIVQLINKKQLKINHLLYTTYEINERELNIWEYYHNLIDVVDIKIRQNAEKQFLSKLLR